MKRTFAFGVATAQGTWPVQEDGFYANPLTGFFAIADGFGGRGAGDMAAKVALEEARAPKLSVEGRLFSPAVREQREAFLRAHKILADKNQAKPSQDRGGCSLLTAAISATGQISLTQCGACVALLVRGGKLIPVLLPQSPPREEFQPPWPEQALGLGELPIPESRTFLLETGDILVLASGGLEWESESFQLELISQLSVRGSGGDLSPAASHVVENTSLAAQGWNRTLLLVERI